MFSTRTKILIILALVVGGLLYFRYSIPPILEITTRLGLEPSITAAWERIVTFVRTTPEALLGVIGPIVAAVGAKIWMTMKQKATDATETALTFQSQSVNTLQANMAALQTQLDQLTQEKLNLENERNLLQGTVDKITNTKVLEDKINTFASQIDQLTYERDESLKLLQQYKERLENPQAPKIE